MYASKFYRKKSIGHKIKKNGVIAIESLSYKIITNCVITIECLEYLIIHQ